MTVIVTNIRHFFDFKPHWLATQKTSIIVSFETARDSILFMIKIGKTKFFLN